MKFAEQHSDDAALQLASLVNSRRDSADAEKASAFRACLRQAMAGSGFAMCVTSQLQERGWGCEKSEALSLSWAKAASTADYAPGHFRLGECHEFGVGVPVSADLALNCYRKSLSGGFGFAAYQWAELAISMAANPPEQEVVSVLESGIQLGEPFAAFRLACWYELEAKPRNEALALKWYRRASDMGHFLASLRMADAFEQGELGLTRDVDSARRFHMLVEQQMHQQPV